MCLSCNTRGTFSGCDVEDFAGRDESRAELIGFKSVRLMAGNKTGMLPLVGQSGASDAGVPWLQGVATGSHFDHRSSRSREQEVRVCFRG